MGVVDSSMLLPVGTILRNIYRIDGYLASGGFGKTYLAHNIKFQELVAIKEFFLKDSMMRDVDGKSVFVSNEEESDQIHEYLNSFYDEASRMHNISHPNIVKVHDIFEENNTAYYVMDYIEGKPLDKILEENQRPFSTDEVRNVVTQILDALEAIHGMGLWHLDIKPENIMLDDRGKATLIDFGTSKQIDLHTGAQITSAALAYTPGYAPLEQQDYNPNLIGPWTDLYSLGATIYNMITNQDPPTVSEINLNSAKAFHFSPETNESLKTLIMWLMSPQIENRPKLVSDVKGFLKNVDFSSNNSVLGRDRISTLNLGNLGANNPQNSDNTARIRKSKKPIVVAALAFFATLVLALGIIFLIQKGCDRRGEYSYSDSYSDSYSESYENDPISENVNVEDEIFTVTENGRTVTYSYTGPIKNDLPNGKGTAVYSKGDVETIYKGNFVNGVRNDKNGKLIYTKGPCEGDVYEGGFRKGVFEGGCVYYEKGTNRTFKGTAKRGDLYNGTWYKNNLMVSSVENGKEKKL